MTGYRDTVTIERDSSPGGTEVPDYSGNPLIAGMPCRIQTISGDSTYRGRMLEAHTSHVVEMQWLDDVTPTCRLSVTGGIHAGALLNIVSTRPLEGGGRARKLEIYCTEQVGR